MAEYIEREAAFNAILKLVPKVDDNGYCWVVRGGAATAIDSIPAADVRPVVRGKWIWFGDCANEGLYCSVCKKKIHEVRKPKKKLSNFCPNCGADMGET